MLANDKRLMAALHGRAPLKHEEMEEVLWPLPTQLMGIELEVEYTYDIDTARTLWASCWDGSLRDGLEWKTIEPLCGKLLAAALDCAPPLRHARGRSLRTSTHVHLNMQSDVSYSPTVGPDTCENFSKFLLLYAAVEECFFALGGNYRKFVGFCKPLTAKPAAIAGALVHGIDSFYLRDKYLALNISSFHNYGTVEFRMARLFENKEQLLVWINTIQRLKAVSYALPAIDGWAEDMPTITAAAAAVFSDTPEVVEQYFNKSKVQGLLEEILMCAEVIERRGPAPYHGGSLLASALLANNLEGCQRTDSPHRSEAPVPNRATLDTIEALLQETNLADQQLGAFIGTATPNAGRTTSAQALTYAEYLQSMAAPNHQEAPPRGR